MFSTKQARFGWYLPTSRLVTPSQLCLRPVAVTFQHLVYTVPRSRSWECWPQRSLNALVSYPPPPRAVASAQHSGSSVGDIHSQMLTYETGLAKLSFLVPCVGAMNQHTSSHLLKAANHRNAAGDQTVLHL